MNRMLLWAAVCGLALGVGCRAPAPLPVDQSSARVSFLSLTNFTEFKPTQAQPGTEVWLSEEIRTPIRWDELVLSWNGNAPVGTSLNFEARAIYPEGPTPFYHLGKWTEEDGLRWSVDGQKDEFGEVQTDTLVLRQPAPAVQIRVGRESSEEGSEARLRFLGVSLLDKGSKGRLAPDNPMAWGRALDVPQRSQLAYEGGRGWCSPTSVSMVLAWWAGVLRKPSLDQGVPEVARGVYDPIWKGTGNWSFNAAYAGQFPELRACVARLPDISELEKWISRNVPPICSVDARKLRGVDAEGAVGHLVVVVGFTPQGDVVLNDPWAKKGQSVRKTVPRGNFVHAWQHSRNTAYLIFPSDLGLEMNMAR